MIQVYKFIKTMELMKHINIMLFSLNMSTLTLIIVYESSYDLQYT